MVFQTQIQLKMKELKNFMTYAIMFALIFSISNNVNAQCKTWIDSPDKEVAENNYQIYKDHLKQKNYEAAFVAWEKLMAIAPAADGKRISPYNDGIKILKALIKKDATKKAEYNARILELHDGAMACLESKTVTLKNCSDDACIKQEISNQLAKKTADLFYSKADANVILASAKKAVEMGGDNTAYRALHPYANSIVKLFVDKKVSAEETRQAHDRLNEIADFNVIAQEEKAEEYATAGNAKKEKIARQKSKLYTKYKIRMNKDFKQVEDFIFDCAYFKDLYNSDIEEATDLASVKSLYSKLKKKGCDETDPFMAELKQKFSALAAQQNAAAQEAFNKNNPAHIAKKYYDSGDYDKAIAKYEEAIEATPDANRKADYKFRIASIQGRKLKQFAKARATAREAAKMRSNWGRPFMLIGDLYAMSARRCGDDWSQRLAVLAALEKYQYAKSIDDSVSSEASKRIGKYNSARPEQSEGFMRNLKAGDKATCKCWIGESVTVKFK